MVGYLIGEDGPLVGLVIRLEEDGPWILGRDAKSSYQTLEDPQVSRRHVMLYVENDQYFAENLSSTNPTLVNGEALQESRPLNEGDILQVGGTTFRFTLLEPTGNIIQPSLAESDTLEKMKEELSLLTLADETQSRWIIKVITGPNTGAEFPLETGRTYIIGKDPATCDIFFQDLSVSKQHAKLTLSEEGTLTVEDLGSRNGVIIHGKAIEKELSIHSQDVVSLGTTSFIIIDREQTQDTLYTPEVNSYRLSSSAAEASEAEMAIPTKKHWKEMFIPTKHIAIAAMFTLALCISLFSIVSLFKTQSIIVNTSDEYDEIHRMLKRFPSVEFTYTPGSGQLFLLGHVLTEVEQQELVYLIQSLPFITTVQNNVVVDEYVWQDMNALLFKNPDWRSVLIVATEPGHFVIKGYLKSADQIIQLMDYVNNNFPYLNKLENQVYVENTLETEVQALLISGGFGTVNFSLSGGELLLSGRIASKSESDFNSLIREFRHVEGIKEVKNYVVVTSDHVSSRINISAKYLVSGTGLVDNESEFVLINGKLFSVGESVDGLNITQITSDSVLLEKDGLKYVIDYNL